MYYTRTLPMITIRTTLLVVQKRNNAEMSPSIRSPPQFDHLFKDGMTYSCAIANNGFWKPMQPSYVLDKTSTIVLAVKGCFKSRKCAYLEGLSITTRMTSNP